MTKPHISDTLAALLPSETQTSLLRACLLAGEDCRRAWRDWVAAVGDPKTFFLCETKGVSRLLSLLYESLTENEALVGGEFDTHLRTAAFRDELRHERYAELMRVVAGALDSAGIDWMALRGAALAHTAYRKPSMRHCHDIDVLVQPETVAPAARAIELAGFRLTSIAPMDGTYSVTLAHESGLPVQLHPRLYRMSLFDPPIDGIFDRATSESVCGHDTVVLCPEDTLVHICAHAMSSNSSMMLRWVCDAHMIVHSTPALDWSIVMDHIQTTRLALPVSVAFRFLADSIGTAVPRQVLSRLFELASEASVADRDAALHGVRIALEYSLRDMWRASGPGSRLEILRWLCFPSVSYVRRIYAVDSTFSTARQYLVRPLRSVSRRASRYLAQLDQPPAP